MPDDAPELAGSLVGSMLGVEPDNSQPTPSNSLIRSSEQAPLCSAMVDVYLDTEHIYAESLMADVLDVVRDWLPKVPPMEFFDLLEWNDRDVPGQVAIHTIEWIRALLTEQARIARGEQ